MAEDNNQENEKKSPIKLILMIVGGIVLLGGGIGLGILMGGGDSSDPSTEISQIIEKKENPESSEKKEEEELKRQLLNVLRKKKMKRVIVQLVQKKYQKLHQKRKFLRQHTMNFLETSLQILKNQKSFLQISLGVSTQYDEQVMANVDSHQLALRSEILTIMSTFSPADIAGREGKQKLADSLKEGINNTLMKVEGFGGVENVHFTSFVLQ